MLGGAYDNRTPCKQLLFSPLEQLLGMCDNSAMQLVDAPCLKASSSIVSQLSKKASATYQRLLQFELIRQRAVLSKHGLLMQFTLCYLQAAFPSPFYFFDEIDCALDTSAALRVAQYVSSHAGQAQYILVSHKLQVFEQAPCLIGVYSTGRGRSAAVTAHFPKQSAEKQVTGPCKQ